MERDIFQRPMTMTHRFGSSEERADLFGGDGTFNLPVPRRPDQLSSRAVTSQSDGSRYLREGLSPVVAPNGRTATYRPSVEVAGDALGSGPGAVIVTRRKG